MLPLSLALTTSISLKLNFTGAAARPGRSLPSALTFYIKQVLSQGFAFTKQPDYCNCSEERNAFQHREFPQQFDMRTYNGLQFFHDADMHEIDAERYNRELYGEIFQQLGRAFFIPPRQFKQSDGDDHREYTAVFLGNDQIIFNRKK